MRVSHDANGWSPPSLPDAKPAEYLAEQVVWREGAGDLAQAVVAEAEFFGQEVERG
jgi:hypothetical protein